MDVHTIIDLMTYVSAEDTKFRSETDHTVSIDAKGLKALTI